MMTILQTSPPVSIQPALAELAAQEIEPLPDRETLCGCAPKWCYG
jgi:hypothetical protein